MVWGGSVRVVVVGGRGKQYLANLEKGCISILLGRSKLVSPGHNCRKFGDLCRNFEMNTKNAGK